ncbi:hypothetical protein BREVNS_0374 [Brevinematales bacterium NS]|nr:hypothetical protein BREVNS_0374 [Brevinematales bacterium NS]
MFYCKERKRKNANRRERAFVLEGIFSGIPYERDFLRMGRWGIAIPLFQLKRGLLLKQGNSPSFYHNFTALPLPNGHTFFLL